MGNAFQLHFQRLLCRKGWLLSTRGELAMWTHKDFPGRRFDTACAVAQAMKPAPSITL
jgi:hypothetical protein